MRKRKGFTLIELLAVIVILGLLLAITIPSVTKYITESRKKTLVTTIGNYISALTNEVNDMQYIFTDINTIYAVPIECIALERGGKIHLEKGIKQTMIIGLMYLSNMMMKLHHIHMDLPLKIVMDTDYIQRLLKK